MPNDGRTAIPRCRRAPEPSFASSREVTPSLVVTLAEGRTHLAEPRRRGSDAADATMARMSTTSRDPIDELADFAATDAARTRARVLAGPDGPLAFALGLGLLAMAEVTIYADEIGPAMIANLLRNAPARSRAQARRVGDGSDRLRRSARDLHRRRHADDRRAPRARDRPVPVRLDSPQALGGPPRAPVPLQRDRAVLRRRRRVLRRAAAHGGRRGRGARRLAPPAR